MRLIRVLFVLPLLGWGQADFESEGPSLFGAGQAKPAAAAKPASAPVAAAPKPLKIGSVTVQGSFRSRLEAWDWFTPDGGDPSYVYSGNLFRLSFSQSFAKWDWQLELAVPFLLGLPENAIAAGNQGQLGLGGTYYAANDRSRNSVMLFPKQGFVRFKGLFGHTNQSLRLGRFEYLDGSEMTPKSATLAAIKRDRITTRLIGNFAFSHVGRSFDGAHYSANGKNSNFTFMGGVPTRGVFQTDGWGQLSAALGYAAYTWAWGSGNHAAETRLFALQYNDWRSIVKTDNRALAVRRGDLANIRISSFGGHTLHAITTSGGVVDMMLWGLGQTGKWGVLDHRASAIAAEVGFQPKILPKLKPWLRAGVFNGSGDNNPNDDKHGTFFQMLPTPRPFARFPFFDLLNNHDILGILILRPHTKVTVSSEFHALRLANRNDLWYLGGGAFQPWTFGFTGRTTNGARSLANLYDTSVEYRVRPNITFTGYLGYADGREVMKVIYPKGDHATFGYLELNYRF